MGVQINGDTGNVIATKGTFSGDVGIGGTLTYEDVTNVDSVGLITARAGVVVGSGITLSKDGDIFATGVTTTGSLVSNGAVSGTTGTFTSHVSLGDSNELRFGDATGGDLKIYHDGNNSAINDVGNGSLYIQGSDNIHIRDYDTSDNHIVMTKNGAVDLYYDGTIKLSTSSTGATIQNGHLALNRQDTSNEGGEIVFNRSSDNANQWFNDVYGNDSTAKIRWHHGGAEKISFSTGGDLNIIDGNLHVASGHGIDFSATGQASGMTDELLDDYEEGTFSPGVNGGTTNTQTFDSNGRYTKIGRQVYCQFLLQYSGAGTNAHVSYNGLPFTSVNNSSRGGGTVLWTNIPFNVSSAVSVTVNANDTAIYLYYNMDDNLTTGSGGFTNKAIYVRVTYEAA